jgi:hypothetical protein
MQRSRIFIIIYSRSPGDSFNVRGAIKHGAKSSTRSVADMRQTQRGARRAFIGAPSEGDDKGV